MDNEAGPSTKPRRSGRATRQTRKNDTPQPDESDGDAKVVERSKKRQKVAKAQAGPSGEGQAVATKPRRRTGRLSSLLDMPIDILYEVFSQLDPIDILKLTRTNKDLRNLLLNKGAISVWKQSLQSVPGLPDCPPDLSIPAYVNLIFSAHCHLCSAYTRTVEWRFRMRICKKCAKEEILNLYRIAGLNAEPRGQFYGLTFAQLASIIPNRLDKRHLEVYSKTVYQKVADEYSSLDGDDAKKQFVDDRTALVKTINQHARACELWEKNRTDSRHQDLFALKEERLAAIIQKLKDLGWGDEVKNIRRPDSLAEHKLVNRPQHLTAKVWSNIKPGIIKFMEEMRVKRLEREFKSLIKKRKAPAMEAIREYKLSKLADGELLPGPPDYCAFEPIQEILKKPVDVEITPSSFDAVIPLLPGLVSQWRDKLDLDMVKHTGIKFWDSDSAPRHRGHPFFYGDYDSDDELYYVLNSATREPDLSEAEAAKKLKLAAAVFICKACSAQPSYADSLFFPYSVSGARKIMFYPQVLAHQCNHFTSRNWHLWQDVLMGSRDNEPDPSTVLGNSTSGGSSTRQQWSCRSISFNHKGRTVAEAIIEIAGLDPAQATSQEMDDLNLRYVCTICADAEGQDHPDPSLIEDLEPEDLVDYHVRVGLFDWRAAVRHTLDMHSPDSVDFSTIKPDDIDDEIKAAEAKLRERTTEEWQCMHCIDTRNEKPLRCLQVIKDHLLKEHEIDNPTLDEDFYRHFAAADRNSFQRPLWVDCLRGFEPMELHPVDPPMEFVKDDNGNHVKTADGKLKEQIIDYDDYDYARPQMSDVDQYDTRQRLTTGHYDFDMYSDSDSDMF